MANNPQIIAADPKRFREFLGFFMDWKITAEQTDGGFSVVETEAAKGAGPPLHYHEGADEFFYVVAGEMTFKVGDEIKMIGSGGFVWIPRRVVHSFVINSSQSRFLFGYVPAGIEQMFIEASSSVADPTIEPRVEPGSNREKFGTIIVGPPLAETG